MIAVDCVRHSSNRCRCSEADVGYFNVIVINNVFKLSISIRRQTYDQTEISCRVFFASWTKRRQQFTDASRYVVANNVANKTNVSVG